MQDLKELEQELTKQRDATRKLEIKLQQARRDEAAEQRQALRPLAEQAHSAFCMWNHMDGCSWDYECDGYRSGIRPADDTVWASETHARWLDRIFEAAKTVPLEKLEAVIATYVELKRIHRDAPLIVQRLRG